MNCGQLDVPSIDVNHGWSAMQISDCVFDPDRPFFARHEREVVVFKQHGQHIFVTNICQSQSDRESQEFRRIGQSNVNNFFRTMTHSPG